MNQAKLFGRALELHFRCDLPIALLCGEPPHFPWAVCTHLLGLPLPVQAPAAPVRPTACQWKKSNKVESLAGLKDRQKYLIAFAVGPSSGIS